MLVARKSIFVNARARKEKRCARMLANARKDHLIPLILPPSPPKHCWICYLQDLPRLCTTLKGGKGGRGSGSQAAADLRWKNRNVKLVLISTNCLKDF